jgi:undecaprenyl-diphosphatase
MDSRARVNRLTATFAVSTMCFAVLGIAVVLSDEADELDVRFVDWLHESVPRVVVDLMEIVTYAGSGVFLGLLALAAALLFLREGRPGAAAFVIATFATAELVSQTLKFAFHRARPQFDDPFVQLTTYSFPSGHALDATATYIALAIAVGSASRSRNAVVAVLCACVVLVVAASRVILGVHYVLDVTAGMLAGVAVVSGLLLVFELAPRGRRRPVGLRRHEQAKGSRVDT